MSEQDEWNTSNALLWTNISQAFTALTLLTGSQVWALEALLQAIRNLDSLEGNAKDFVLRAVELAETIPEGDVLALDKHHGATLSLPQDLQKVLGMPASLRHCFVLRILLGIPAHRCAAILGQPVDRVNESTKAAVCHLAGLDEHMHRAKACATQTEAKLPKMQTYPMVLIVGAGPTGLTLACELARRGVPFRLVEAATGPQPGSRGKGVQPRTIEAFDDLGIVDQVIANGRFALPIRSTAPGGQVTLSNHEPADDRPDIPYLATLITPEWRVEEALRRRLAEFGSAVEFGTQLENLEQSDQSVTAVVVKDGKPEIITSHYLAGCDGGHSIVRKQAGIVFEGETRAEVRMIVADVEAEGLGRDIWEVWSHEEGMVSLCPLPSTDVFQYQAGVSPGQDPELSLANMQAILQRRSGRTDVHLNHLAWSSLWRCNVRLVDRYRQGRVFLAGDAAHIHSPAGGQGMNTGIQDARNLGWKLAAVANGAPLQLLDSYEAERRPVAAQVLALSNARLKHAIEQKSIPTQRNRTTMQLDITYRGSALVSDDRDETILLRAGDRAPDATKLLACDGEYRLFDLLRGGHFTLLNFSVTPTPKAPSAYRTLHVVTQPVGPGEIADSAGHLAGAYFATSRTIVLIRPDGYIGLISDAGEFAEVTKYFASNLNPNLLPA